MTNNIISVTQGEFLKIPAVMAKLDLKPLKIWKPEDLPMFNYNELLEIRKANEKAEREKRR